LIPSFGLQSLARMLSSPVSFALPHLQVCRGGLPFRTHTHTHTRGEAPLTYCEGIGINTTWYFLRCRLKRPSRLASSRSSLPAQKITWHVKYPLAHSPTLRYIAARENKAGGVGAVPAPPRRPARRGRGRSPKGGRSLFAELGETAETCAVAGQTCGAPFHHAQLSLSYKPSQAGRNRVLGGSCYLNHNQQGLGGKNESQLACIGGKIDDFCGTTVDHFLREGHDALVPAGLFGHLRWPIHGVCHRWRGADCGHWFQLPARQSGQHRVQLRRLGPYDGGRRVRLFYSAVGSEGALRRRRWCVDCR
jgi:hypothetical protein